jgi:membrane-associated phospholipid phosphatase
MLQIFFPKANMGRLLQPSGRRGFPSGHATP